jgi:hypothetical protein
VAAGAVVGGSAVGLALDDGPDDDPDDDDAARDPGEHPASATKADNTTSAALVRITVVLST